MKKITLFFSVVCVLMLASCEERPITIPSVAPPDTNRVVLIEEITGVKCPNCPAGAAAIEGFKELFPGQVVSIAYHSNFLASPLADSQYDFRSDEAQEHEDLLGIAIGKPSAAINRLPLGDNDRVWLNNIDTWGGFLTAQLEVEPVVELEIETEYNSDTRELGVTVKGFPLENTTDPYNVTVMILQDHIIDPQEDQSVIIDDYEHNHVFSARLSQNDVGDSFATGFTVGTAVEKSYSFTLPQPGNFPWVAENCEVVAFVTNVSTPGPGVVEQAAKKKIVE